MFGLCEQSFTSKSLSSLVNIDISMTGKLHEEMLVKSIDALKRSGLRVVRIDKRKHPDAIAIDFQTKTVIAVEVETNPTGIYLTRRAYMGVPTNEYEEEIIVTTRIPNAKSMEAYEMCRALRQDGRTVRGIRGMIKYRLGEDVSIGTIHKWINGSRKPRL